MDESALPGEESRERLFARFGAQQLLVGDGLYALLRSLERFDGAVNAGSDLASAQIDAVATNAAATAGHQDTLVALTPEVNAAWDSLRAELNLDPNAVTLEEVQRLYIESVGADPASPAPAMAAVAQSVGGAADDLLEPFDTGLTHPVLDATDIPPMPSELIDAEYVDGLNALTEALRSLVIDV